MLHSSISGTKGVPPVVPQITSYSGDDYSFDGRFQMGWDAIDIYAATFLLSLFKHVLS